MNSTVLPSLKTSFERICIFFLGITIGLVAGYKYGVAEMRVRFENRMMKRQIWKSFLAVKNNPNPL